MAEVGVREFRRSYGAVAVIRSHDFDLERDELVVLVAPSGCGKSTLLRMIAGLESVSSGTIHIGDRLINNLPPAERDIAMVFQNRLPYPHETVAAKMAFLLHMRGMDMAEIARRVARAAAILGLTPVSRPLSPRAFGRPAPEGRGEPRHRPRIAGLPLCRTALDLRRQAPRPDADREPLERVVFNRFHTRRL